VQWVRDPENKIRCDARPGRSMLDWCSSARRVRGRAMKFHKCITRPPKRVTETLQKVPFVDPDVERMRETTIMNLNTDIRIASVQIGVFHPNPYTQSRAFSVEWVHDCIDQDAAWLRIHYDHQVIRITVCALSIYPWLDRLGPTVWKPGQCRPSLHFGTQVCQH
jgi:hypothetical protein